MKSHIPLTCKDMPECDQLNVTVDMEVCKDVFQHSDLNIYDISTLPAGKAAIDCGRDDDNITIGVLIFNRLLVAIHVVGI